MLLTSCWGDLVSQVFSADKQKDPRSGILIKEPEDYNGEATDSPGIQLDDRKIIVFSIVLQFVFLRKLTHFSILV